MISLSLFLTSNLCQPRRCSIVRLIEWGTTLVKKEDRYVIDLKNNKQSPAAKHKSVKFHRKSILPLPKLLTEPLDALSSLRKHKGFVFLNSKNQCYSTSAWTNYIQSSFQAFGIKDAPAGSLLRSIFVTFLNGECLFGFWCLISFPRTATRFRSTLPGRDEGFSCTGWFVGVLVLTLILARKTVPNPFSQNSQRPLR